MRVDVDWGVDGLELEVPDAEWLPLSRSAPAAPVPDVEAAVRQALEEPIGFPPLRRALTPDDQVAILVDESVPRPARMLTPILEHLVKASVSPAAVTLLCMPPTTGQPWLEDLPDEFQDVHVEIHEPADRKKLAYLATTRKGRRIYLNRTAVDADQLVVLSRMTYDPLLGVTAGEGAIFPGLADEESRLDLLRHLSLDPAGQKNWPVRNEAAEVAWLMGAPFLVQVIVGHGEEIIHVVGGPVESSAAAEKLLHEQWHVQVSRPADVVIGTITGNPQAQTMLEIGRAFQAAARIVRPGGKVVLLTRAAPQMGAASEILRGHEEPGDALRRLAKERPADMEAGYLWASAAEQAKLYLLSQIPSEEVEEMFVTPLEQASQVRRFIGPNLSCAFLPDANQTLATVR